MCCGGHGSVNSPGLNLHVAKASPAMIHGFILFRYDVGMTSTPAAFPSSDSSVQRPAGTARVLAVLRIIMLVALFSVAALHEARHLQSLTDPGVWLQLRTGNWILTHHSLPRSGLFSRLDTLHWTDATWGSQVLLAALYRLIGLRAIPIAQMVFGVLFAISAFLLAGGRRGGFWLAVLLSGCAQLAMFPSLAQFQLLNATLLSAELWTLFASRASGRRNLLFFVPLLMLFWANLDWHFVFGLLVLFLFLGAEVAAQLLGDKVRVSMDAPVPPFRLALIATLSLIASVLTPYSYLSYSVAWQNWFGETEQAIAPELKAMDFRTPEHYLLMLLAMLAFLALGRQHLKDIFKVTLLVLCASISFAMQRDAWMVVVVSVAILGEVLFPYASRPDKPSDSSRGSSWVVAVCVLVVFGVSVAQIPAKAETLLEVTSRKLPVRACDFIRQNHLPAPIYNELSWGDFLTWYLPDYPVSIDDRYELYGDENLTPYYEVMAGMRASSLDTEFASANTILLGRENNLLGVPETYPNPEEVFQKVFPGFQQVYRDDVAVVLTKPR